jgi:CubicO group peptidase (beta-lactamase class C family)
MNSMSRGPHGRQQAVTATARAIVVCLLLSAAGVAHADPPDDYIAGQMKQFHLPGLALAVVKDGMVIKAQGYGLANVARKTPMTPETVLKIGSVSKQFIASGIMLLARERRLALDDPISKYLQDSPASWSAITLRHLLTHTAGLVRESPVFDPNKDQPDAVVLKGAYPVALRFSPGEKWEYSNVGYYALAETIHRVTGQAWNDYLAERIFKPAGMTTTFPTNTKQPVPNRAQGYTGNDNANPAADWLALRPSGAFLSTVLDLAKWDALLYAETILTESERRQMTTQVRLTDGSSEAYGFGWHVDVVGGQRRVWHGGGLPGFSAQFVRFPDAGVTIILLANGDDVDTASIANGLAALHYLPRRTPGK